MSEKTRTMRRQVRFGLALVLLSLVGGLGLYISLRRAHSVQSSGGRTYRVDYVWDRGPKSLRIFNAETGAEESDPKWRAKVVGVAQNELPRILQSAGLARAVGRFYADTWGQEVLYLPRFGTPSDPDLARDPDVTPLMSALDRDDGVKARELIATGANVNASDQHGWTALMRAAMHGDSATVRALVTAGAEVNVRNREGETALFPAAFLTRVAVAQELVKHGADVNASSKQGITPLIEAANHSPAVARLLIQSGAKVNAKDVLGETALMMAARAGRRDIVQALIRAGADVNAKDNQGRTALSSTLDGGHTEAARVLRQAGARE